MPARMEKGGQRHVVQLQTGLLGKMMLRSKTERMRAPPRVAPFMALRIAIKACPEPPRRGMTKATGAICCIPSMR